MFQFDGRTPMPNSAVSRIQGLLSDGKYLFEFGGQVTEIVVDQTKANQIINNVRNVNFNSHSKLRIINKDGKYLIYDTIPLNSNIPDTFNYNTHKDLHHGKDWIKN